MGSPWLRFAPWCAHVRRAAWTPADLGYCAGTMRAHLATVLLLGACLSLLGCCCSDQPQPDASEVSGLRATIASTKRTPQGVEVEYALEWVAPIEVEVDASFKITAENMWLLQPSEPTIVHVWDRSGVLVERHGERVDLPPAFLDRSVESFRTTLTLPYPASGESLSVALGRSGLESRRAPLPPR